MKIIKKQSFYQKETIIPVRTADSKALPEELTSIKSCQIPLYVSVLPFRTPYSHDVPVFPAILDTGLNYDFFIDEGHLKRWANLNYKLLPRKSGSLKINESPATIVSANVWLHFNTGEQLDNRPGAGDSCHRSFVPSHVPQCLEKSQGIAIHPIPDGVKGTVNRHHDPRLPTLGLRALVVNNLHLAIDAGRMTVTISRGGRSWLS